MSQKKELLSRCRNGLRNSSNPLARFDLVRAEKACFAADEVGAFEIRSLADGPATLWPSGHQAKPLG